MRDRKRECKSRLLQKEFWGCVGELGEAAAGVHRDLACSPLVSRSLWQALSLIYGREPSLSETHETQRIRWRVWGKKISQESQKSEGELPEDGVGCF